ncbi:MAG: hydrogenase maturation nickel metallochaperone HypA [Chloroflexi bacterium]|nr:hydrogenase maturation nickel metallochaperone HypA [Chloroflexota bacterium]
MTQLPDELLLQARALINQAVAEAAAQGQTDIRALYFVTYPAEDITPEMIRAAIETMRQATPAGHAELHFTAKPGRYICWNCCGLRYEAVDGVCPNCGHEGLVVPMEMVVALDHIEV